MLKWMLAGAVLAAAPAAAEEIGEVTTAIKILGANHRIVVEAFEDPKVEGVACWLSRARTGGIKGGLGIAEDTYASVSCQQTGPVKFRDELDDGEQVFSVRAGLIFKHVQVVRFFDKNRYISAPEGIAGDSQPTDVVIQTACWEGGQHAWLNTFPQTFASG